MWETIFYKTAINNLISLDSLRERFGLAGAKNIQGESVKKLDVLSNQLFTNMIKNSYSSCLLVSEEDDNAIVIPKQQQGKYIVCFDPLDGSSNIECLVSIGSIFGVWKNDGDSDVNDKLALKKGDEQVAAGYALYGNSTVLVICLGKGSGVHVFTLDPEIGEFLLTEKNMQIPPKGNIYSINEGYTSLWDAAVTEYIANKKDPKLGKPYSSRYVGSMVADVHRTLKYGGIFMYPANKGSPKGKLRVLYECFPLSFIIEEAGGKATTGQMRVLDIEPSDIHQRSPIFLGSTEDVQDFLKIVEKYKKC